MTAKLILLTSAVLWLAFALYFEFKLNKEDDGRALIILCWISVVGLLLSL